MMLMWESCPAQVTLENNAVHIWRVKLDISPSFIELMLRPLSPQECDRANRLQFERDRRRFIVSHGVMRIILSRYLGCEPEQVQYQMTENGKPFLEKKPELHFNLAHSHEIALIAVTPLGEIGIDVEYIRPLEDINRLARQCFSAQEYQQYISLPAPEKQQAFFTCWTRKEAFLKALGSGLAFPLDNFTVSLLSTEPARLVMVSGKHNESTDWTLQAIDCEAKYSAAFALRANNPIVKYIDWV